MCKACHSCFRVLMMVFNFIFVLCGLGLFSIGLYFYLSTFFKSMGVEGASMVIVFYVTMGIGTFTLIVGACGCCGAYHESPCLLGTYFVLLLIIFASEIAGGFLCYKYSEEVQETVGKAFAKGVNELSQNPDTKDHWMNGAQRSLSCCGLNGPRDYIIHYKFNLPNSCCPDKCSFTELTQVEAYSRMGCKAAWNKFVQSKWIIFAGVLLGIALIELLGLVFSMCLCCSARSLDYDIVETRA